MIIHCNNCRKVKRDIFCTSCTAQKLKELHVQNEQRTKQIMEKCSHFSSTSSFIQKLKTLKEVEAVKGVQNTNRLTILNAENITLTNVLDMIRARKKKVQATVSSLKEHNIALKTLHKDKEDEKEQKRMRNLELTQAKLKVFRGIYNIHHIFPNMQAPLRLKIVQDKFFEATQTGVIESQHYSLDISGFSSLKGMSIKHAQIICEVFARILEFVMHIAEIEAVTLPIRMRKTDGRYWLTFYNDPLKSYELYFDKNTQETTFFQAVSLLFTNFVYLNRIMDVKLHIPINSENSSRNDILDLNPLLDSLINANPSEKPEDPESLELPLEIINLGKRTNSIENEFEVIEDT